MKMKPAPRKKTTAGKFAAAVKAAAKKAVAKRSVAKKAAPGRTPVKKIQPRVVQAAPAPTAVKHGPLHLPSRPEPAYSVMHRRDWAHQPPPHKIPIPKR